MRMYLGLTLALAVSTFAAPESLPARLGYAADARLLIIHADDAGLSHGVNVATAEAIETGSVSSFSVMAPSPWLPEIAALCRDNPHWDVGVHLALTSEWQGYRWLPVAGADAVPSLLDDDGYMHRDVPAVARDADAAEAEAELRAQIERVLALGIDITHLDTHMGAVFARADIFAAYYRLGEEYGIPVMVTQPTADAMTRAVEEGYPITDEYLDVIRRGRLPALDELVTGVEPDEVGARAEAYREVIRDLRPGVTQLIVHLATDSAESRAITNAWERRYNDYRIFTSPEMARFLDEQGVTLITWRDMGGLISPDEAPGRR
jgi:chitin disaccharide deacetylase